MNKNDRTTNTPCPLAFLIIVVVIKSLILNESHEASAQNWPRFLGEHYDSVAAIREGSDQSKINWENSPKLLWSLDVGEGYGLGSIWGDEYYQFDAVANEESGMLTERLRCIDLRSGAEKWNTSEQLSYRDMYGYENGPRTTPTLDGTFVFTFGVDGQLLCRRRDDGQRVWVVDTKEKYGVVQNFFGVGSSPLLIDGEPASKDKVILMVGGSPPADQSIAPGRLDRVSPNRSLLVAFDRKTGKEIWSSGNDLASYSSPRTLSIEGRTVVLVFARSGLIAVNPNNGKVLGRYDHRAEILESVNAMTPVAKGNQILISECYDIGSVLLEAVTGDDGEIEFKEVWKDPDGNRRKQAMRCHWSTPVLIDGFLYGCSGRNAPDSDFRCIDFSTGEVQWVDPRRTRSSVTRVGNHLVVLNERGTMQVLRTTPKMMDPVAEYDLTDGSLDGARLGYPCWAAPIVVGDKLIVRGDKKVLCFGIGG